MLYVVLNDEDLTILARWDAWYIHCEEEAMDYIEAHGLEILKSEITFMGDKLIYVE